MNFNKLAKEIFEQNKAVGWWDDMDRCKLTALQLVSTEIAEATEAERKDLMDDHLPHRKGGEVELADALIRVLDMAGAYGWHYYRKSEWVGDVDTVMSLSTTIGSKHFMINALVVGLGTSVMEDDNEISMYYYMLVEMICAVSGSQGYDIEGAMVEKLEYNAQRADHKRENRAKEGGKKF